MRIVLALGGGDTFRHLEKVVRCLLDDGHDVRIVTRLDDGKAHPNLTSRALRDALAELPSLTIDPLIPRTDPWWRIVRYGRELLNYATFFKPGHPSAVLWRRWKKWVPPPLWPAVGNPVVGRMLATPPVLTALRGIEWVAPPVAGITRWLETSRADAILACPYVTSGSIELEYVKAAKAVGLPSMVAVQSWDNLTTKGTFHIVPDTVFVWNEAIREEAIALHGVPADRITITGAPTFDYWFDMKPTLDRAAFARSIGLDADAPYVVYLCSSRGMIQEETGYVLELSGALKANAATRHVTLLVRPHPLNMIDWAPIAAQGVKVWPPRGEFADTAESRQTYFHTFYYAEAAVGVNTSAMLEAAVADRPCVTVIDDRYRSAQTSMGHFRHLLEGGFLEVTRSYDEAVGCVAAILGGRDAQAEGRRRFVERFIRPRGMGESASRIMASAIEAGAARGRRKV